MKNKLCLLLCLFPCLAVAQAARVARQPPGLPMARAAAQWLATLTPAQRDTALFAFEDAERFRWYYVPIARKGLAFKDMTPPQRDAALALLRTTLSTQGVEKAREIMALETILKEMEGRPPQDEWRHPEKYYVTVFGTPSGRAPWGWRLEGHHLSLHFTAAAGRVVSETPAFFGTNPAIVPTGSQAGKQVLKQEADLGFALLHSLTPAQREKALLPGEAPGDIVTANGRRIQIGKPEGIHYPDLTTAQQQLFRQLLDVYLQNYTPALAADLRRKVEQAGMAQMHFAWAGHLQPQSGQPHYYRLHGPVILIEYDNSQNNANHVHSVVRDLTNDFGDDVLLQHYRSHKHGAAATH